MNTASNVSTGKPNIAGAVHVAPRSAALPTDATTELGSDYTCLGFVSEDGLENENSMDFSQIKAWGGAIVYRALTEMQDNFSLKLIESENVNVMQVVYGKDRVKVNGSIVPIGGISGSILPVGGVAIDVAADTPQELIWVFELALRGGKKKRIVIPDGAITSRETITYNDADAIVYGITVAAYPDGEGVTHKEYIA